MKDALAHVIHRLVAVLQGAGVWWSVAISLFLAVASLGLALVVVLGWSVDHFKHGGRPALWQHRHPVIRAAGVTAKNVAGLVLLVLGLIMALPGIPGQGILTMIIGLT